MSDDVQRRIDWLLGRRGESASPRTLSAREQLGYTREECRDDPEARRRVRKLYYAQRERAEYEASRDIGEIPEVQNPERRKRCSASLKLFIEEYFRSDDKFNLPWASFHLEALRKMEASIINGGLFALALPRGSGKALALDTPIPTPDGWSTMGALKIGDVVYDEQGNPCHVVFKSEVFTDHKCYKVTFTNGESVIADAGHLWQVEDHYSRHDTDVRTTEWLSTRYVKNSKRYPELRFRLPIGMPLQGVRKQLPVPPYALGAWLGDGTAKKSTLTLFNDDAPHICDMVCKSGWTVDKCKYGEQSNCATYILNRVGKGRLGKISSGVHFLREAGVYGDKHIPEAYLRASFEDRLLLLQGIMDTDGYSDKQGHCDICIKSEKFALSFGELLSTMGIRYSMNDKFVILDGKKFHTHRFYFNVCNGIQPFSLPRKQIHDDGRYGGRLMIAKIEEVETVPTQCIMVDSKSHLFRAGRTMFVTHNSSISERAIIWAILYGYRRYVVAIGDGRSAAQEILETVQTEIESNEKLIADFPEVCYPIAKLDGIVQRATGQRHHGKPTDISWGSSGTIVFPTIEGSPSSGSILVTAGINSRLRGMKRTTHDGRELRPDFVFLDDVQNDRSAASQSQIDKRLKVIRGTVLGLAGAGNKMAAVMACTVIRRGDVADICLDRQQSPEWNGTRYGLLESMPVNEELWKQYHDIWSESQRTGHGISEATEFYRKHQRGMDEGAMPTWPERYEHDELSAVQYAMDKLYQNRDTFYSEYQNQPLDETSSDQIRLEPQEVIAKVSGLPRYAVPQECTRVVAYIDVQAKLLPYVVMAFSDDGTGHVIDYGTYPDLRTWDWTLADVTKTYQTAGMGFEGSLTQALDTLTQQLIGRKWIREDGTEMQIERCLVDAAWGVSSSTVVSFCSRSQYSTVLMPSFGRSITADKRPYSEYRRVAGQTIGDFWLVSRNRQNVRVIEIDTNFVKTLVAMRIRTAIGDRGSFQLWGKQHDVSTNAIHRNFSQQMTSEYGTPTSGRDRTVNVWRLLPGRDNHYFDAVCGCYAAASERGTSYAGQTKAKTEKRAVSLPRSGSRKGRME